MLQKIYKFNFIDENMPRRMVNIVCVLHEPIHHRTGHWAGSRFF